MPIFDRSALLAVALSTGPLSVLAHGLIGAGRAFTAALLVGSATLLAVFGRWRKFRFSALDVAFALFACAVVASFWWNGYGGDRKELYLLAISIASYPAARGLAGSMPGRGFVIASALIVVLGSVATLAALIAQWDASGKPFVFGIYETAPAQFMSTLVFLMIALACTKYGALRAATVSAVLAVPLVIFAASMVRSTFIGAAAAIAVAMWRSGSGKQRRKATMILASLLIALALGLAIRSDVSVRYIGFAAATLTGRPDSDFVRETTDPTRKTYRMTQAVDGCPEIFSQNTLAIRKQLYVDALSLLPAAGLFGIGMDRFTERSCIIGHGVHNTILQVAIELGWPAAVLLVAMIIASLAFLWPMARSDQEMRFVLCGLIFVVVMSMGHGRISREGALFLFLGYAAAVQQRSIYKPSATF